MFLRILVLLLLTSCFSTRKQNKSEGISIMHVFPIMDNSGHLRGYDTSIVGIARIGTDVIYKLDYRFDSIAYGKLIKSEKRHHYFFLANGNSFGFDVDSNKIPITRRISVNSIFKNEWIKQNNLYPTFGSENTVNLISNSLNSSNEIKKEFHIQSNSISSKSARVILVYKRMKSLVEYSIIKELDTIPNFKLTQVKTILNPQMFNDSLKIDGFESNYEIDKLPEDELLHFIFLLDLKKRMIFFEINQATKFDQF